MKMNKYIAIIASLFALSSCVSDEILEVSTQPESSNDKDDNMFSGVISNQLDILPAEGEEPSLITRTTITDGVLSGWTQGDKVSISDGTLMFTYLVKETTTTTRCSFAPKDGGNSFTKDGENASEGVFSAFYPADAVIGWNGSKVTAKVFAQQDYAENMDASNVMGCYMAARTTTTGGGQSAAFDFAHVSSVIDVNLTGLALADGVSVSSVSIKSNNKEILSGKVTYDTDSKEMIVSDKDGITYSPSTQSDVVMVSNVASDATFVRFYVLPVKLSGVTITVKLSNGEYYSKVSSTAVGKDIDETTGVKKVSTGDVCKPYYKKYNFGTTTTASKNLWMATVPSNVYFSMISTPGAHDACTLGVSSMYSTVAKCQDMNLEELLNAGVRQFDLRPGYLYKETLTLSNLYIYHGSVNTNVKYVDAMQILVDFVKNHPTEAISVIMVKENNTPLIGSNYADRSQEMWNVINACHNSHSAYMKVLDHSYYTLQDFRGKICYVNRTGTECTNTVRITNWPDDAAVTDYSCRIGSDCYASLEDRYNTNGETKQNNVKNMMKQASANTNNAYFHYIFTSSANFPSTYAGQTNPILTQYLNENNLTGPIGYVLSDFIGSSSNSGEALLQAIVNQNYKYCFKSRSRLTVSSGQGSTGAGLEVTTDRYADGSTVLAKPRKLLAR